MTKDRWLRVGIPTLLVLVWLVGGAIGGPYFGKVDEVATNEQSTFLPSSAEATRVIERLPDFTEGDTIPAVVVVTSATGFDEDRVAELTRLDDRIAAADLVVTGEGAFDFQSLRGKLVGNILRRAEAAGTDRAVVAGVVREDPGVPHVGLVEVAGQSLRLSPHARKTLSYLSVA